MQLSIPIINAESVIPKQCGVKAQVPIMQGPDPVYKYGGLNMSMPSAVYNAVSSMSSATLAADNKRLCCVKPATKKIVAWPSVTGPVVQIPGAIAPVLTTLKRAVLKPGLPVSSTRVLKHSSKAGRIAGSCSCGGIYKIKYSDRINSVAICDKCGLVRERMSVVTLAVARTVKSAVIKPVVKIEHKTPVVIVNIRDELVKTLQNDRTYTVINMNRLLGKCVKTQSKNRIKNPVNLPVIRFVTVADNQMFSAA